MNLIHITTVPQTFGFIIRQMLFMRDKGWRVSAISSPDKHAAILHRHSIPFYAITMWRKITPFRDLLALARLWKRIRSVRPTIVHAHTPKAGLLGMIAAWLAGVPVRVFHVHGLPHLTARGFKSRFLVLATRVSCALAQRVFCVSPSIRRVLIDQGLCSSQKVIVPANGSSGGVDAQDLFDPDRIGGSARLSFRAQHRIPASDFVVAFIGRLVREKGLVELFEAWTGLRSSYPQLHLLLAGDFEPQDPVPPHIVALLQGDARVRFAGFCANIPQVLAAVDLLVLPTYREGFPNVLLEAAAMALPVVATEIPGCVDAVRHGVTGTLVPPRDPQALAKAIEQYVNDPDLRHRHGYDARKRVLEEFRSEPIWEFIYEEYDHLLAKRGLGGGRARSGPDLSPAASQPGPLA